MDLSEFSTPPARILIHDPADGAALSGLGGERLDECNFLDLPAAERLIAEYRDFRAALAGGVVLAKSLDPCVSIWPPDGWEEFTERAIRSRDPFRTEARKLQRYFHAGSFDAQLDSAAAGS